MFNGANADIWHIDCNYPGQRQLNCEGGEDPGQALTTVPKHLFRVLTSTQHMFFFKGGFTHVTKNSQASEQKRFYTD